MKVNALTDSILSEKNQAQLAELDVQYNTEKKEAEIKFLKQESDLQNLELEKKTVCIMGSRNRVVFNGRGNYYCF